MTKPVGRSEDRLSPCCQATVDASRGDGVWIGSCSDCGGNVLRINPRTGVEEWLDGASPWTEGDLRPVESSLPASVSATPEGSQRGRSDGSDETSEGL